MEVVDERKDFLRRRFDRRSAFDVKRVGPGQREEKNRDNQNHSDESDRFDEFHTDSSLTGRTSMLPTRAGGSRDALRVE